MSIVPCFFVAPSRLWRKPLFVSMLCAAFFPALLARAAEPQASEAIVHPRDGAIMVYVPQGKFIMGMDKDEADQVARLLGAADADALWMWECYPRRTLDLPGFFIDQYEVTVGRWQRFAEASAYTNTPREISRHYAEPGGMALPVGEITQSQAMAYAAWACKTLPSDEQWEKACRGTDGRWWPWGNTPPAPDQANMDSKAGNNLYTWVGRFPKGVSPYGCHDMIGNQYEWTCGTVAPYPGNPDAARMAEYRSAENRCVRGGSWYHGYKSGYASKRMGFENNTTYYHIGFRCVWIPPQGWFDTPEFAAAKDLVAKARAELETQIAKAKASTNNGTANRPAE